MCACWGVGVGSGGERGRGAEEEEGECEVFSALDDSGCMASVLGEIASAHFKITAPI